MHFSDTLTIDSLERDADHLLAHYLSDDFAPLTDPRRPNLEIPDLAYDYSECDADDCDDAQTITRSDLEFRALILADLALFMLYTALDELERRNNDN